MPATDKAGLIESNPLDTALTCAFHLLAQSHKARIIQTFHGPADMLCFLPHQPCQPVHAREVA